MTDVNTSSVALSTTTQRLNITRSTYINEMRRLHKITDRVKEQGRKIYVELIIKITRLETHITRTKSNQNSRQQMDHK